MQSGQPDLDSQQRSWKFSLHQHVQTGSQAYSPTYSDPEVEADHSP